jgi:predicted ABC-type exoprotein transport system permease subunit
MDRDSRLVVLFCTLAATICAYGLWLHLGPIESTIFAAVMLVCAAVITGIVRESLK